MLETYTSCFDNLAWDIEVLIHGALHCELHWHDITISQVDGVCRLHGHDTAKAARVSNHGHSDGSDPIRRGLAAMMSVLHSLRDGALRGMLPMKY